MTTAGSEDVFKADVLPGGVGLLVPGLLMPTLTPSTVRAGVWGRLGRRPWLSLCFHLCSFMAR